MQRYVNKSFEGLDDHDSAAIIDGISFDRCRFERCVLSATRVPEKRTIVRNMVLRNCINKNCHVFCVQAEDLIIDGLSTTGVLQPRAAVFRHVVLRGRIDSMMLIPLFDNVLPWDTSDTNRSMREANDDFYRTVDWAIDVREADAMSLELVGIPATLVRRDPERSIAVRADSLRAIGSNIPGVSGSIADVTLQRMLQYDLEDVVIVACERDKRWFREYLSAFEVLRRIGVADPD